MKRKMIIAIAVILLLSITATFFVGCDEIFKNNEKRDAMQVVASVNYKGQTANVYKHELAVSFNNYAYMYVSYYGMTYEQAANYLVQSLAQQELLVLYAKEKVSSLLGLNAIPADVRELLSQSEINKAYKDTNESFITSLKTIVENDITETNYNSGNVGDSNDKVDAPDEITEPVYVRFNSNGGSLVEKVKTQKGYAIDEPAEPTKAGYTFYGWYAASDLSGEEFDFDQVINESITLYAKWESYTAPRTEMPEVEEDEDEDYDADDDTVEADEVDFFSISIDELYDELKEEDFVEDIVVEDGDTLENTLKDFIKDAVGELKSNMKKSIFNDTDIDGYNYYLVNQMETLLIERLKRMIGESVTVTDAEVEAEFAAAIARNKETFSGSDANYTNALTNALSTTFYHPVDQQGYGFVNNILLKLDEESVEILTTMNKNNPTNDEATTIKRNQLISQMMVKVSNPVYKSTAVVKDAEGKEIELRDPMTDPANPYNKVGTYDASMEAEGGNDYNNIVKFSVVDGKGEITFGAQQHEAMPYLVESVPAFDKDGKKGIIHQIQDSLQAVRDQVTAGNLSKAQGVYWLRKVAETWLYLVGDDSGALNSQSNNGGLGYLVTPEGEESSFLEDFTTFARDLIKAGTGSSAVGTLQDADYQVADAQGNLAGNFKAYVVADSFIESDNTSNAYAGVFVLLNSLTVVDGYFTETGLSQDGVLPMDYIITVAEDQDDVKTIKEVIYDKLLEAKKQDAYNLDVNTMGTNAKDYITYNDKVIASLYKDLV